MIEVNNVGMHYPIPKRYKDFVLRPFKKGGSFKALNSMDLCIEDGDRVAFLGVNGAGKTTLLKLIGGLLYPTQGKIVINGYDTISDNLKARKSVGFVLNEERSFYWRLTGAQNLRFFGMLDNLYGEALEQKIEELLQLVGLEVAGHKIVAGYSSGMKQRLAIARGLLSDPKILILDEPTRALDPGAVEDVKALISKKIHTVEKRTLLIATHRFDEAEFLCNKVCVMKNGHLLAFRDVQSILQEHASIADFYHATMNNGKELAHAV